GDIADARQRAMREPRYAVAEHLDRAIGRREHAEHEADRRRLAAAVGAEEAVDGARGHGHREIAYGEVASGAPREVADADHVTHFDSWWALAASRSIASRRSVGERPRRAASESICCTNRRAAAARSRPFASGAI